MFAVTDVWDYLPVAKRFAFGFGAVADRAVLAKERGFIALIFGDQVTGRFRSGTSDSRCGEGEINYYYDLFA